MSLLLDVSLSENESSLQSAPFGKLVECVADDHRVECAVESSVVSGLEAREEEHEVCSSQLRVVV